MTALSIAEAEPRATADPQVSAVRRRGVQVKGDLASVTELPGAARRKCAADPEISRRAGVSRTVGVSRRAAAAGVSRRAAGPALAVSRWPGAPGRTEVQHRARGCLRRAVRPGSGRRDPAALRRCRGVAPGPVRLTSRGRAVVAGLVAAVAVCAACCWRRAGRRRSATARPEPGTRGCARSWSSPARPCGPSPAPPSRRPIRRPLSSRSGPRTRCRAAPSMPVRCCGYPGAESARPGLRTRPAAPRPARGPRDHARRAARHARRPARMPGRAGSGRRPLPAGFSLATTTCASA